MEAKKKFWEKAKQDGAADRVNRLLSASYILLSEAYLLIDEANATLQEYGLLLGESKRDANRIYNAFDDYFNNFKRLITAQGQKENYFHDLDRFNEEFRKWANLNDEQDKQ